MKFFATLFMSFTLSVLFAQEIGDTLRVQAFNFNSTTRDTVLSFPDDPSLTYEKVILKYTMRCTDALVSTGSQRNLGCGEWDYSCNTYLVDSSTIEEVPASISSHFITNFNGTEFPYKSTPVYDYFREEQTVVNSINVLDETEYAVTENTQVIADVLPTERPAAKSYFLLTQTELSEAGIGNIDGVLLNIDAPGGEAKYMKIKLKHSTLTELSGVKVDDTGFTEVYHSDSDFRNSGDIRLHFHTPFTWDGGHSILMQVEFSNGPDVSSGTLTHLSAEDSGFESTLLATDQQHVLITSTDYIEANNYKGVSGSQNRTVEAWIKTSTRKNAEICSWGSNVANEKWVFRLNDSGQLRVENANGGTVSTGTVDDGEWHHVACVLDGNNLRNIQFYIDGQLDVNSSIGTTDINTNADGLNVRISRGVNNRYLDAEIDEIRIWDTNLSGNTIQDWMRLKADASHPNYDNLQLYYSFDQTGEEIVDESPFGRNASVVGNVYRVTERDGAQLFKEFRKSPNRPYIRFYDGNFDVDETVVTVERPFQKDIRYYFIERSIDPQPSNEAFHDVILTTDPAEIWEPVERVFNALTGDFIEDRVLTQDDNLSITDLNYTRRFPMYHELVSFVTPYGIGLDFGEEGKSWYLDMTDYAHLFQGNRRLLMTLGGQWQEEMDLEFQMKVGTPPRDVVQYQQLWQATNRTGSARINDIVNGVRFQPVTIDLSDEAEFFKMKSSITGHGAEGEFHQNGGTVRHKIAIDGFEILDWSVTQECSFNPIYPQGGTWVYDRQGWCPGERSRLQEENISDYIRPGFSTEFDYYTSNPQVVNGDYRYQVAHQLIGYGPANHSLDASVVEIMAPNNSAEFTRIGTICANPIVVIRNTGSTTLEELTIEYWINDASEKQSYTWTGDLEFMESEEVTIPSEKELWFNLQEDGNRFFVEISNPNGGNDEYSHNNTLLSNFDLPEIYSNDITIDFRTNSRPNENAYFILDENGDQIASNVLPAANTLYSDDHDLEDGCYKLIVRDIGHDGVEWWANPNQGAGWVRIRDRESNQTLTFNPDFGGGFEFSFSTEFVLSAEELDYVTSLKISPNPTSDMCILSGKELNRVETHLVNMEGKKVQGNLLYRNSESIAYDVSGLQPGVYFLVVRRDDNITTTRKFIVR